MERVAGLPILVLVTYRPGYRPAWIDKSYVTQIALQRLTPHDSRQVMQSVLQTTVIPESLVQQLLLKAEGNPFFLEELAWTAREHGDARAFSAVPNTIQAVLAARIDRLPPTAKRLLQVAAVLGKEVRWPLLQGIAEPQHEFCATASGICRPRNSCMRPTSFLMCSTPSNTFSPRKWPTVVTQGDATAISSASGADVHGAFS